MVDKLEEACESKSPAERARMHTHFSDHSPIYKKQHWNWPRDTTSTYGQGGYSNRCQGGNKPAVVGQGGGQGVTGSGN